MQFSDKTKSKTKRKVTRATIYKHWCLPLLLHQKVPSSLSLSLSTFIRFICISWIHLEREISFKNGGYRWSTQKSSKLHSFNSFMVLRKSSYCSSQQTFCHPWPRSLHLARYLPSLPPIRIRSFSSFYSCWFDGIPIYFCFFSFFSGFFLLFPLFFNRF